MSKICKNINPGPGKVRVPLLDLYVARHAQGSFSFKASLEIALLTRRECVLQMQSRRYLTFKPFIDKKRLL